MQKKKRKPDAAAAKFAIGIGIICLAAVIFASKLDLGMKCMGAATSIMAFLWGSQELAAARKWRQKLEDERKTMSVENRLESDRLEKAETSAPVTGWVVTFTWLLLSVTLLLFLGLGLFMLFHHQR
jgi:hypothetical protein